jgi:hypothetical protein
MEWQDAAGLAQLSQSVEDVFSSGNLPKAAETLATMRHCLSAVGEVFYFLYKKTQTSYSTCFLLLIKRFLSGCRVCKCEKTA